LLSVVFFQRDYDVLVSTEPVTVVYLPTTAAAAANGKQNWSRFSCFLYKK
jgi:hypothetical protein